MLKVNSVLCFILFLLISCGGKEKVNNGSNPDLLLELPLPTLPENIDSAEIAQYLLVHFWDGLDFTDTAKINNSDFMEQNFANFAHLLIVSNDSSARKAGANALMKKAEVDSNTYKTVADIAYHYLYDPNSPLLNEESYIPFMEIFQNSSFLDVGERERNRLLLEGALKNRPGTIASDFVYITREGQRSSLYTTPAKGDLLVLFYDPDCDNCKETIKSMADNSKLAEMIKDGKLIVLAIYSGDEKELWKKTALSLPEEWIVGYNDGSIEENDEYIFRASPTLYLLDEKKTVLAKDLSPALLN